MQQKSLFQWSINSTIKSDSVRLKKTRLAVGCRIRDFSFFLNQQAWDFNHLNTHVMSKVKKENAKSNENLKKISQFPIINPYVAGIDVSASEMMVAYPISDKQIEIKGFGCFTCDLKELVKTLKENKVTSVAMESTGVYWISLFLMLQEADFEVYLVNAKHAKNVTGRKTDESDAEWLYKLHSCGLLSASFQPDNLTRTLRSLVRHRKSLTCTKTTYVNRMQKALELMNIKLHTIISDIDGKTGMLIVEAILNGERNPAILADLRDKRIKAERGNIIKSLEGYYTKEHLFELKQCYTLFRTHQSMIEECDLEIEQILIERLATQNEGLLDYTINQKFNEKKQKNRVSGKNRINFDAKSYLDKILEVDVTKIAGISDLSALAIYSEVGSDLSMFKTEHHFTSWLGIAPNTKISGGKIISSRIQKKKHNAGQAFRIAASTLKSSKDPLGDYFRRMRAKVGTPKAIVATARKLAIIYYKMITTKEAYNPKAIENNQFKYKEMKINQLKRKIELLEAS